MDAAHELALKTDKQLSIHEAVCAARYEAIDKRLNDGSKIMKRMEYGIYISIAISLFGPKYIEPLLKYLIGV